MFFLTFFFILYHNYARRCLRRLFFTDASLSPSVVLCARLLKSAAVTNNSPVFPLLLSLKNAPTRNRKTKRKGHNINNSPFRFDFTLELYDSLDCSRLWTQGLTHHSPIDTRARIHTEVEERTSRITSRDIHRRCTAGEVCEHCSHGTNDGSDDAGAPGPEKQRSC